MNDNLELSAKAQKIISENDCFAPNEIIAEVVYVLNGVYGVSRSIIEKSIVLLMDDITFSDCEVMKSALSYYAKTKLDFVDCIIAAEKILDRTEISSFDKKLNNFIKRNISGKSV